MNMSGPVRDAPNDRSQGSFAVDQQLWKEVLKPQMLCSWRRLATIQMPNGPPKSRGGEINQLHGAHCLNDVPDGPCRFHWSVYHVPACFQDVLICTPSCPTCLLLCIIMVSIHPCIFYKGRVPSNVSSVGGRAKKASLL